MYHPRGQAATICSYHQYTQAVVVPLREQSSTSILIHDVVYNSVSHPSFYMLDSIAATTTSRSHKGPLETQVWISITRPRSAACALLYLMAGSSHHVNTNTDL
jgi:hypothetical protein